MAQLEKLPVYNVKFQLQKNKKGSFSKITLE
jgi:hypothetical protein